MSNFMTWSTRIETRLGEYAMRLFQVEAHLRRGELRAAYARLQGLAQELEAFGRENEFPAAAVLIGAQLGLMSGGDAWLRGRLPAAMLGAAAGWLAGHSLSNRHRRHILDMIERAVLLEHLILTQGSHPQPNEHATPGATSP